MAAVTRWRAGALCFLLATDARALCGDGARDGVEECDDGNAAIRDGCDGECRVECEAVGPSATEHTCLHGAAGPFATRTASAAPGVPLEDVSTPHTYFTVALPGPAGDNRAAVAFRPLLPGTFATYLKERYPVRLIDDAGGEIPVRLEHAIGSCAVPDSLTWVRVYSELSADAEYRLEIGPWDGTTVSLAVEFLGFERRLYRDADGDGFGVGPSPAFETWCAPPAGYVAKAGDCDDGAASVYPGAPEHCDGVNSDCDGVSDPEEPGICDDAAVPGEVVPEGGGDAATIADGSSAEAAILGAGGAHAASGGAAGERDAGVVPPPAAGTAETSSGCGCRSHGREPPRTGGIALLSAVLAGVALGRRVRGKRACRGAVAAGSSSRGTQASYP